jgi:hypothetical protein
MLVREFVQTRPSEYNELVRELAAEWKSPSQNPEPEILLERDRGRRIVHVYVIWSKWSDVDRVLRSEAIMDAAAQALPAHEVLNIIVAMGLTPEESERSGIAGAPARSAKSSSTRRP